MKITVRNNEFFVNLLDFETAKAYEDGAERLKNFSAEIEPFEKPSDKIAKGCEVIAEVIDSVLGKGATEKLFNGKKDLLEHSKIWLEITDKIEKEMAKEKLMINTLDTKADSNA